MSDWITVPLRDLVATTFSGEWGSDPYPYNARVLRATDITDDMRVNLEGGALRLIPKTKLEEKKLLAGDIILEGSGGSSEKPVGRVAYFDAITSTGDEFIVSNFFRTLRPNNHIVHPKYLYWLLNWFYKQPPLRAMQQQTTGIINLKLQQYLDQLYQLPQCKVEQVKVADILDALDAQIRETEAIIAKLQQVKQGLLHDLLTRGVDENGELRPSYKDAPELYKPSELGLIPNGWDVLEVAEVCEEIIDCKNRTPPEEEFGYAVVKTSNIKQGCLIESTLTFTDQASYKIWTARGKPKTGDVVITREAPIGESFVITEQMPPLCLGQRTMLYRPDIEKIKPEYLHLFIRFEQTQRRLIELAGGSTVGHVRVGEIKSFLILKPKFEEQEVIAEKVLELNTRLHDEVSLLVKLKLKKSGLMDDLLTGKKRVTDLLKQQAN